MGKKKKISAEDYFATLGDTTDESAPAAAPAPPQESLPPPAQESTPKGKQKKQENLDENTDSNKTDVGQSKKSNKKKKDKKQDDKKQDDKKQDDDEAQKSDNNKQNAENQEKKAEKKGDKKQEKKGDKKNEKKGDKKSDKKGKDAQKTKAASSKKPVNPKLAALKEMMEQKKLAEEKQRKEEEERIRLEEEAIRLKKEEEERERKKQEQLAYEKRKKEREMKKKGLHKTKKQLEEEEKKRKMIELMLAQSKKALSETVEKPKKTQTPPEGEKKSEEVSNKNNQKKKEEENITEQKQEEEEKETSWEDLLSDEEEEEKDTKAEEVEETKPKEVAKKPTKGNSKEEVKQPKSEDKEVKTGKEKLSAKSQDDAESDLRSPICCVLGHVDTGKTKILDKIRNTNVQLGEAGGITQQIGATYVPMENIKIQTKILSEKVKIDFKVPGLLIIDTPGHESFTNLRTRGSSLCDIAILVVDIMHGLERQTIESINLLKQRKTPFVVALNKIDQLYDWKSHVNSPIRDTLKLQPKHTLTQFEDRVKKTLGYFQEQGFNAELYYKNKDVKKVVSLVPTSAITGEGLPDLLALLVQLTQKFMAEKISYKDQFQCTVLEVKVIEGYGTTIDVILVNGVINEGDQIVVCGLNGPIVTNIRALLRPKPLKEIRVKGEYLIEKEVKAAMGIKIAAQDLDGAVPGSSIIKVKPGDDIQELKEEVMADLNQMLTKVSKSGKGVFVQSSTLGSLEALLEFLSSESIPVSGINIGPIHKKDVVVASVMLDSAPEYAVILAFDVEVAKEAQEYADKVGVKIFKANIIYHLFDNFTLHMNKVKEEKKKAAQAQAVWPCIVKVIPEYVFHNKNPITVGVDVVEGKLKLQTPLIVMTKEGTKLDIGRVIGIEHNRQPVNEASQGKMVSVKIDSPSTIQYGRHFDHTDLIYSKLTRASLDSLKINFKDELKQADLALIIKIKKILGVA